MPIERHFHRALAVVFIIKRDFSFQADAGVECFFETFGNRLPFGYLKARRNPSGKLLPFL